MRPAQLVWGIDPATSKARGVASAARLAAAWGRMASAAAGARHVSERVAASGAHVPWLGQPTVAESLVVGCSAPRGAAVAAEADASWGNPSTLAAAGAPAARVAPGDPDGPEAVDGPSEALDSEAAAGSAVAVAVPAMAAGHAADGVGAAVRGAAAEVVAAGGVEAGREAEAGPGEAAGAAVEAGRAEAAGQAAEVGRAAAGGRGAQVAVDGPGAAGLLVAGSPAAAEAVGRVAAAGKSRLRAGVAAAKAASAAAAAAAATAAAVGVVATEMRIPPVPRRLAASTASAAAVPAARTEEGHATRVLLAVGLPRG